MSSDAVTLHLQPRSYDGDGLKLASRTLAREQPSDYVLWSLFNLLFLSGGCFCCFSFSALIFSIKARDRKLIGDPERAATYGKKAKYLNIAASIIGIGIIVACIYVIILIQANYLKLYNEMRKKP